MFMRKRQWIPDGDQSETDHAVWTIRVFGLYVCLRVYGEKSEIRET